MGGAEPLCSVLGPPFSALPLSLNRLRPFLTRIRRAGARESSTPLECRWRRTKGTTQLGWAETCHTYCMGELVSPGLPELLMPQVSQYLFTLSFCRTSRAQHHPCPRLVATTQSRIPLPLPCTLLLQMGCSGKGPPCSHPVLGSPLLGFEPRKASDEFFGLLCS